MKTRIVHARRNGSADAAEAPAGDVGAAMTVAAQACLASLQPDELAKAAMKFDDPARLDWTNIPKKERKGLPIRDMSAEQRTLCHRLLRAALSPSGYDKARQDCVAWKTISARERRI